MATEYRYKSGRGFPVDAQTVGVTLDRLQRGYGGRLTPRLIVDEARPKGSVLHPIFEWDDARAAEAHRQQQARQLITSVRIVRYADDDDQSPQLVRCYVNLADPFGVDGEAPAHAYRPLVQVIADEGMRLQLLVQARRDMKTFMTRYMEFQELIEAAQAVMDEIDRLQGPRSPTEAHP